MVQAVLFLFVHEEIKKMLKYKKLSKILRPKAIKPYLYIVGFI